MTIDTLQEFVAVIEAAGELVRVREPVRARLEIAEIADRCMKSPGGGPALLFDRVVLDDGRLSEFPVAINEIYPGGRFNWTIEIIRTDSKDKVLGVVCPAPPVYFFEH